MNAPPRYALYFVPEEDTALSAFGRWWFARDPNTARRRPLPDLAAEGLAAARQWEIVAGARRYGFHATLKAPFRLAAQCTAEELCAAMAEFAGRTAAVAASPLRLDELNGFLALRPNGDDAAIQELAAACVRAFDEFRAPPTPAETARRLNGGLNPRQEQLLAEWGYPYVFEEFRFHMSLTAPLADGEHGALRRILAPRLRAVEAGPLRLDSICLCVQERPERPFVLRQRFPLAG